MKTVRATFEIEHKGHIYKIVCFLNNGKTRVQVIGEDGTYLKDVVFTFKQTLSATTAKKILNQYLNNNILS